MSWTGTEGSHVFRLTLADALGNNAAFDLEADTFKVALYNTTTTPDRDVATATLTTYNGAASQWVTANEVTASAGTWPSGGQTLASLNLTPPSATGLTAATVMWDAADTASGASTTITGAFGCLVYDTTVSSRGICFNYFGGSQSVTLGTMTVVWSANGIFRATV